MRDLVLTNCRLDGRYDVLSQLGRGSYAEIYTANDTIASTQSVHKTVVIKALNVFLQNDLDHDLERTLVENFQNEAISLDRVRHPNVISRLGHGTAKDLRGTVFHYLVLEYLPGGDLSKYCQKKELEIGDALNYLEQVCAGLANAHQNGIIHRDIKPHNILLTEDLRYVKIADFGVARSTAAENPITRVGTNIYAPPEHSPLLAGQTGLLTKAITPAADIYSLAKTAYFLFTGETPRYLANQPITDLPHAFRVKPWASRLIEVLNRATLEDPGQRHQDVAEFWRDLSSLAEFANENNGNRDLTVVTKVRTRTTLEPQAQVAVGFSPNKPNTPRFDTTKELKFNKVAPTTRLDDLGIYKPRTESDLTPPASNVSPGHDVVIPEIAESESSLPDPPVRKRRGLKAFVTLLVLLVVFSGSLFATYNYLLGRPLFTFSQSENVRLGRATTDINLRPSGTTSNTPIGIVTRGSEVRILQTSNNWHEVVIIRQGRIRNDAGTSVRGWVYSRYVAEDD